MIWADEGWEVLIYRLEIHGMKTLPMFLHHFAPECNVLKWHLMSPYQLITFMHAWSAWSEVNAINSVANWSGHTMGVAHQSISRPLISIYNNYINVYGGENDTIIVQKLCIYAMINSRQYLKFYMICSKALFLLSLCCSCDPLPDFHVFMLTF